MFTTKRLGAQNRGDGSPDVSRHPHCRLAITSSLRWLDIPHGADYEGIGKAIREKPVWGISRPPPSRPCALKHEKGGESYLCVHMESCLSYFSASSVRSATQDGVSRGGLFLTATLPPALAAGALFVDHRSAPLEAILRGTKRCVSSLALIRSTATAHRRCRQHRCVHRGCAWARAARLAAAGLRRGCAPPSTSPGIRPLIGISPRSPSLWFCHCCSQPALSARQACTLALTSWALADAEDAEKTADSWQALLNVHAVR